MSVVYSIEDLTIEASTVIGPTTILDGVDLELHQGEILGLIGESGSGKTTAARAMIGLLEKNLTVPSGALVLNGETVFSPDINRLKEVRGSKIGTIFQSAAMSLNPLMKVERQLREVVRRHQKSLTKDEIRDRLETVLKSMRFTETQRVLQSYPHQLSGGMRQRVAIALAVITNPQVIIADECTSALDVTTQWEVVRLLKTLTEDAETTMMFVTHDLMLAQEICTRIAVMYAGQIVESGTAEEIVTNPQHPYTKALLDAVPSWDSKDIKGIAGTPPLITSEWRGCRFAPRCPLVRDECKTQRIDWTSTSENHGARCILLEERFRDDTEISPMAMD